MEKSALIWKSHINFVAAVLAITSFFSPLEFYFIYRKYNGIKVNREYDREVQNKDKKKSRTIEEKCRIQFIQVDLFMVVTVTSLTQFTFIKMFQFHDHFQYKLCLIRMQNK